MNISAQEKETVLGLFPVIHQLKDDSLKEKVIRVWVRVWQESGIKDLEEVPNFIEEIDDTLVKHHRFVTAGAVALAQQLEKEYGIPINYDYLIAAGIIHDVDKLRTFQMKEGHVRLSDFGKLMPHGAYGLHAALEEGLPPEIAHILLTHSLTSKVHPGTVEGILIEFADQAYVQALKVASGHTLPPK